MILNEIIIQYPRITLMVISVIVTFISLLITKNFTNQSRMKELKDMQKACQIQIKDNKGNPKKMEEIQTEMMKCSAEMMKISFKPLLITLIPFLLLFSLLGKIYAPLILGKWLFPMWIWYYLITSIVSSIYLRKWMKVY